MDTPARTVSAERRAKMKLEFCDKCGFIKQQCECEPIKTNADRIRAMSDEELAELIPVVSDLCCKPTEECMRETFIKGECTKTVECALKWLQSEVEG